LPISMQSIAQVKTLRFSYFPIKPYLLTGVLNYEKIAYFLTVDMTVKTRAIKMISPHSCRI